MAIIEVKYFNTFLIKKIKDIVTASPQPTAPYANVPGGYTPVAADDWYVEESRIRGGYNNTTVDFGVKAYLDEENTKQQHRFNTLIYSGIFNSRTGVNDTNQFSVGEDITRSTDPANGSIQKLYAEDTNLIIFQEDKVSRALIDKDAIYSAEGNGAVTSSNLVIGQIVAYAGEYGISTDPFSFAVYGYRKYFTDRKKGCVLRLSADGITEISSYGMHDFFRDELASADKIIGGWDIHNKNYILSVQSPRETGQVAQNGQNAAPIGNNVTVTLNASIGPIAPGDNIYSYTPSGQVTGQFYGTIVSVIQTSNPASFVANIQVQIPALQNIICWTEPFKTVAFDESVLGWTSFFDYKPDFLVSLQNNFYSLKSNYGLWLHNSGDYGKFYNITNDSNVTVILNKEPSLVKNFKTINYEGSDGWQLESMTASSGDISVPIGKYALQTTLSSLESDLFVNNFKRKENKFFANLINNSPAAGGEVLWGPSSTGLKGFFTEAKIKLINSDYPTTKKELFAVSSDIVESSY